MANNPKKVKDPTEVALSAIQEALNISDTTVDHQPEFDRRRTRAADHAVRRAAVFRDAVRHARRRTDRPVFDPIEEPRAPAPRRQ